MLKVISQSISAYLKNLKLILFFSIPLLIAFLVPIFVKTPVYVALGAVYLRTGSIPDVSSTDIGVMAFSFLISLFMISFAIVNINLVIKSMRTSVLVSREVIRGIGKYTLNVFWLFLTFELLVFIVQLLLFGSQFSSVLYPLVTLVLSMLFFYCPSALVIDELRPWRAIEKSFSYALSKLPLFALWLAVGLALLAASELLFFAIFPQEIAIYAVLALDSLFIMPFLIVLQTQVYLSKYTIAP